MADDIIQANLSQFSEPVVLPSYKPKVPKRPGTIAEWTEFVARLAQLSDDLAKDARVLLSKRREAQEARPGGMRQRQAEKDFSAVLKRATEHCQYLANAFLATGMPREHLENHLIQCGTEKEEQPKYEIALVYSKLMGIPFRETRVVIKEQAGQEPVTEKIIEDRTYTWAREVKPAEMQDFFRTMRAFNEQMPELAGKFRSGKVHLV